MRSKHARRGDSRVAHALDVREEPPERLKPIGSVSSACRAPSKAGAHIPETVLMGPGFRRDDNRKQPRQARLFLFR